MQKNTFFPNKQIDGILNNLLFITMDIYEIDIIEVDEDDR